MKSRLLRRCFSESDGQTLVEFAISVFLCLMLLFGVVDIGRMVLVYTTMSNAARAGVRYAMVHGSDNLATTAQIRGVVNNYLAAGYVQVPACSGSGATQTGICVTYPDTTTTPGSRVQVTVSYPYQPLTSYFPLSIKLGTTSQGVITF